MGGCRIGNTRDPLVRLTPNAWCPVGRAVLMRVFDKAEIGQARIQAFDKRGFQSLMFGNPPMGKKLIWAATWDEEQNVVLESKDGTTMFELSYQLVRNKAPRGFCKPFSGSANPSPPLMLGGVTRWPPEEKPPSPAKRQTSTSSCKSSSGRISSGRTSARSSYRNLR